MSNKVDMKVFEDVLTMKIESGLDLDAVVFNLANGDISELVPYEGTHEQYKQDLEALKEALGYEHLDQEGGGEGGAEYCYGVFKLHDKIYRAEYCYYSYDGHNYEEILDTLREVKPVEKTITVYE